jgi:aspartate/methionine/tyrosine aminotransferase
MNATVAKHVARLATNVYSCATTFVQRAGMAALGGPQDEARAMVAEFRRRRDVIVEGLSRIPGITCQKPLGSFYVFPNIRSLHMKSSEAETALLQEAGVAALSGTAFGSNGEGFLRFSYANSVEQIREGLKRFETLVQSHAKAAR